MPTRTPRISTRGYYDLVTGRTLKKKLYDLHPKSFFERLDGYPEFTIVVHGMRNNKQGALEKFRMAQKRLRQLGYKYPVIGFSYDSNVKAVQYKSREYKTTKIARLIAKKNGSNLAKFLIDVKKNHPDTKIRLIGHSLGTEVIFHALFHIVKRNVMVNQVYFFGSSLSADLLNQYPWRQLFQKSVSKVINYYSPNDDVLKHAHDSGIVRNPLGYTGALSKTIPKYSQKKVKPLNHRFVNYLKTLNEY
ncbi:MAG: DUF726 domain-containing protein [Nitrososphaera sp.]